MFLKWFQAFAKNKSRNVKWTFLAKNCNGQTSETITIQAKDFQIHPLIIDFSVSVTIYNNSMVLLFKVYDRNKSASSK